MLRTRRRHFSDAFVDTMAEFTANSTLDGYKYLGKLKITTCERSVWFVVEILATYVVVYLLLNSWRTFVENPTTTSLDNPNLPIGMIPFPGVSICGINKISRLKAGAFAKKLSLKTKKSEELIMKYIKLIGHMYNFQYFAERHNDYVEFQSMLDDYYNLTGRQTLLSYTAMQLIRNCTELLSDCNWKGEEHDCDELFVFETTMEGHCCVFNYVPWKRKHVSRVLLKNNYRPLTTDTSGYDMGLTTTINLNMSDYLFSFILSEGVNIHIFYTNDFPDTTSGGLIEQLVPMGSEAFVRLEGTNFITTDAVGIYPIEKRKCWFKDEAETTFGRYSYSDCILECKLRSILALCQCVPFQFARAFETSRNYPQCNLADLICLDKYKSKWSHMYPYDYLGDETNQERQESLMCEHCMPSCFGNKYKVSVDFAYLDNSINKGDLVNYTILHVFFEKSTAFQYKQDVVLYWFEIIGNFGGSCSVIIGISLISILELIYFFTIRLYKNTRTTVNFYSH